MLTQPAGFTTPTVGGTLNATVQKSGLIAPSGLVVGKNLQVSTNVSLNGNAPQAVSVTVQSLDSTRLQFACPPAGLGTPLCTPSSGASSPSVTVLIPQNSSQSANFFVRGYDSAGSIGYTISAPGYGMLSPTMPLAPSGFAHSDAWRRIRRLQHDAERPPCDTERVYSGVPQQRQRT